MNESRIERTIKEGLRDHQMFALEDGARVLAAAQLYAGLFLGAAALCGLVTFLQAWLFNLAGTRLTDRLRVMTFRNFLRQVGEPSRSI